MTREGSKRDLEGKMEHMQSNLSTWLCVGIFTHINIFIQTSDQKETNITQIPDQKERCYKHPDHNNPGNLVTMLSYGITCEANLPQTVCMKNNKCLLEDNIRESYMTLDMAMTFYIQY